MFRERPSVKVLVSECLYMKNYEILGQPSQGNIKIREKRGGSEGQKLDENKKRLLRGKFKWGWGGGKLQKFLPWKRVEQGKLYPQTLWLSHRQKALQKDMKSLKDSVTRVKEKNPAVKTSRAVA